MRAEPWACTETRCDTKLNETTRLAAKLNELAAEHVRWGYRPLCDLIRAEGHRVNHKRAYRVYRDEGLVVKRKRRKRAAWLGATPSHCPMRRTSVGRWTS